MRQMTGIAASLLAVAVLVGCMPTTGAQQEEPAYTVASAEEAFEIRDYDAQVVAQHSATAPYRRAVEQGYIRLERYFTGENATPQPIAMRRPVMVREDPGEGWTTMFLLPEGYRVDTAPDPVDRRIRVVELPPRRVAALKFKGGLNEAVLHEQADRLATWLEARGIAHQGGFTLASYDAPWKPAAWRSNEVLVALR